MSKCEAILYGYKNKKKPMFYVGYHKTTDADDVYSSSSTSPNFRIDWNRGDLEKVVLAEGTVPEMINLEYQVLSHFNAGSNPQFYNRTNGGGVGVDKNYSINKKILKRVLDWVEGKQVVKPNKKKIGVFNKLKMQNLVREIKDGSREVIEVSVQQLYTLSRNQVRMQSINHEHVEELALAFSDPATALNFLTPVVILVDASGRMLKLLDGNHRLEAAYVAKWVEIPAIAVTESEFEFNNYNQEYFGVLMNDQPYKVLGNNEDDLTKQLMTLAELHPELEVDSAAFLSLAKDLFGGKEGLWHPTKITRRCQKLADSKKEDALKSGSNFISYSSKEIDKLKRELTRRNPKTVVITQGSDSICNSGIGGVLNSMTANNVKKGIILVHYPKYQVYLDRDKHVMQFNKIMSMLKEGTNIKLQFLNPFIKDQIDGLPPISKS